MSENKLVGSLALRTIDIDPTRVAPFSATNISPIPVPFDNTFGYITG